MERPFVYINMAMTADGKITSASRDYPRFTSAQDRRRMDRLRAQADAVLVGAQTMRSDNPPLHVRDPQMQAYRKTLGRDRGLIKLMVSARLDLEGADRFFEDADGGERIIVTIEDAPQARLTELVHRAQIWQVGHGRVDLPELLRRLKSRGVERLLVEGGAEINWGFIKDDLVDEINVTIAPSLLGGRDAPTIIGGDGFSMDQQRRLRLLDVDRDDDELYLRWQIVR